MKSFIVSSVKYKGQDSLLATFLSRKNLIYAYIFWLRGKSSLLEYLTQLGKIRLSEKLNPGYLLLKCACKTVKKLSSYILVL